MSESLLGLITGFVSFAIVMSVFVKWQTRKMIKATYGYDS